MTFFVGREPSFCILFAINTAVVIAILVDCYLVISPYCSSITERGRGKGSGLFGVQFPKPAV